MSVRDEILARLRNTLADPALRFPGPDSESLVAGAHPALTAAAGDRWALARHFCQTLTERHGSFDLVQTPIEARLALATRLLSWHEELAASRRGTVAQTGHERTVLCWAAEALPLPDLEAALADNQFTLLVPADSRAADFRDQVRHMRFGLTGVLAAFASTGSILVAVGPGCSVAASLLPRRHLALVPLSRLYATPEAWLQAQRGAGTLVGLLRQECQLLLISGPSRSSAVDVTPSRGVQGPQLVHALLFDDLQALIGSQSDRNRPPPTETPGPPPEGQDEPPAAG